MHGKTESDEIYRTFSSGAAAVTAVEATPAVEELFV